MVVEVGMEWPVVNQKTGKPSTTGTAKQIWLKGLEPACVAAAAVQGDRKDAPALKLKETLIAMPDRDWRYGYADIVEEWTRIQAEASPQVALQMCEAGLDALSSTMRYRRSDNTTISARDAVLHADQNKTVPTVPRTVTIRGEGPAAAVTGGFVFASPRVHVKTGQHVQMTGTEAEAQFKAWRDYGCMEPSACKSATAMAHGDIPMMNEHLEDKVFVLLGATSALGPAKSLLELGATVAAIARPNSSKLTELQSYARTQTCGTLLLPSLHDDENDDAASSPVIVGANLMEHAPHLAQWITSPEVCPTANTQIILCSLAYLDGEANVRACVAMDLIAEYVCLHHPNNTALSFLISPGTVHAVPEEAAMDAKRRYEESTPFWHKALTTMTTSQLQPSYTWLSDENTNDDDTTRQDGTTEDAVRVLNGLSLVQGPNYALSKTVQMWRSMVAASQGHVVSCPLAPPSRTDSMVSHATVSAALDGMPYLEPLVIFAQEPCRTLMTVLMLHDIFQSKHNKKHDHPLQLFFHNSVHGGMWRSPYLMESVSAISFIFGKVGFQPSGWSPDAAMAPM